MNIPFLLQANINSIGSLARQIQRGSKSQEILGQTVKNFATVETTISSTENNIAKLQVDRVKCSIREAFKKKYGIIWEFFPT